MNSVRNRVSQIFPVLALLLASGPALGSSGPSPAFTGAIVLWFALCFLAYWLMRTNLLHHARLAELEARLGQGRRPQVPGESGFTDAHAPAGKPGREQACAGDAERSRIAREIHDDLGQNLLALRIDLSLMQVATKGIHPSIHQKAGQMASTVDQAIRSLKAGVARLWPQAQDAGLKGAIEQQLSEFTRLSALECELDLSDDACGRCTPGSEAIFSRVLQEALANVARHSEATLVRVTLASEAERIVLRIQDDGIDSGHPAASGRPGLAALRERAIVAGGQLEVESSTGSGTVVTLALPAGCPLPVPSWAI